MSSDKEHGFSVSVQDLWLKGHDCVPDYSVCWFRAGGCVCMAICVTFQSRQPSLGDCFHSYFHEHHIDFVKLRASNFETLDSFTIPLLFSKLTMH